MGVQSSERKLICNSIFVYSRQYLYLKCLFFFIFVVIVVLCYLVGRVDEVFDMKFLMNIFFDVWYKITNFLGVVFKYFVFSNYSFYNQVRRKRRRIMRILYLLIGNSNKRKTEVISVRFSAFVLNTKENRKSFTQFQIFILQKNIYVDIRDGHIGSKRISIYWSHQKISISIYTDILDFVPYICTHINCFENKNFQAQ
eukprot:TRINITY_DN22023_c0_g1_i12.p2 TRINITY_DN22023_c0_g1~~TRINITY_DN22023_c0_g1_i12.p2  ORF type:complete len:198 (-),score=-1.04 TRINITY_DN22023_c0_g1_i12:22-615(-)